MQLVASRSPPPLGQQHRSQEPNPRSARACSAVEVVVV